MIHHCLESANCSAANAGQHGQTDIRLSKTPKVLHGGAEKSPNGLSEQWVSGFDMLHPKTGRAFRLLATSL